MLGFMCPCRCKLFKDHNILISERSLGILHLMLCGFGVLFDYTVLVGTTFPFLHFFLGVHGLKLIFKRMEALIQDLGGLRGDLSLIVPQICLS